jgi:hypothetical protein
MYAGVGKGVPLGSALGAVVDTDVTVTGIGFNLSVTKLQERLKIKRARYKGFAFKVNSLVN